MVELQLVGVMVHEETRAPFLELRALDGTRRMLPIFIGVPEATAIRFALEGRTAPRPLTHDVAIELVEACGGRLDQVVITEFRDQIYFAEIHLTVGTERRVVSSRPSDAIAFAVRRQVPVFANDQVIEECALRERSGDEEEGSEELVDEFRRFIEEISPEDFGGSAT